MQIYGGNKYLEVKSRIQGPIIHLEFCKKTGIELHNIRLIPYFSQQFTCISEIPSFTLEPFKATSKEIAFENIGTTSGLFVVLFQDGEDLLSVAHDIYCGETSLDFSNPSLWQQIINNLPFSEIKIPPTKDAGHILIEIAKNSREIPIFSGHSHLFITVKRGLGIFSIFPTKVKIYTHEPTIYENIVSIIQNTPSFARESIYFTLGYRILEFQTILYLPSDTGMLLNRLAVISQCFTALEMDSSHLDLIYQKIEAYTETSQLSDDEKQEIMVYFDKFTNQLCHPLSKFYQDNINEEREVNQNPIFLIKSPKHSYEK